MTDGIISAIISGVVTLAVCMINNNTQSKKIKSQHDLTVQEVISKQNSTIQEITLKQENTINLIDYRLTELSERVDKHNSVVERTFELEKNMKLEEERMKVANHRIEDLEKRSE